MTKDARHKIGLYIEKRASEASRSFRVKTGMPAFHGYLSLIRISTNVVVGTVTEDNLKTTKFHFTPFDLAKLKKLLQDFDSRLLTWKTTEDLNKKREL